MSFQLCIDCSCQGRATTDANDEVVAKNNNHDHPPETAQATVAKVVDKMKDRAKVSMNQIYKLNRTGKYRGVSGAVSSRWGSEKHKEEVLHNRRRV